MEDSNALRIRRFFYSLSSILYSLSFVLLTCSAALAPVVCLARARREPEERRRLARLVSRGRVHWRVAHLVRVPQAPAPEAHPARRPPVRLPGSGLFPRPAREARVSVSCLPQAAAVAGPPSRECRRSEPLSEPWRVRRRCQAWWSAASRAPSSARSAAPC